MADWRANSYSEISVVYFEGGYTALIPTTEILF